MQYNTKQDTMRCDTTRYDNKMRYIERCDVAEEHLKSFGFKRPVNLEWKDAGENTVAHTAESDFEKTTEYSVSLHT
jgi:hypothetical protein